MTHENSVVFFMSHFSSYLQRSDTDVVIHVQLIAPLIKLCACHVCMRGCVRVHMSLLTSGGVGGHGQICILKATLHTSNCMIHLFITTLICLFPRISKQRSHRCATLLLLVINSCVCRNLLFN